MMMIIPVASKDLDELAICPLKDRVSWMGILLEGGTIKEQGFYDSHSAIPELVDYIIVQHQEEEVRPFQDEGIEVLVAPTQRFVDDIVEAFIFKELHQLGA
ncbi:hypothetical protein [Sulfurospirillum sp. 1612]|uniref:hypothetical protein n=1 Tax=Sulfurospirillum sp. 1612 TaxID=3094835 RepID=UPI002F925316